VTARLLCSRRTIRRRNCGHRASPDPALQGLSPPHPGSGRPHGLGTYSNRGRANALVMARTMKEDRNMTIAKAVLVGCIAAVTAFSGATAAQSQQPPVKNIVLVHGAFADGSSWAKVIPILEQRGFHVVAVQNPLTSLSDDARATRRILAMQDGPVILVG